MSKLLSRRKFLYGMGLGASALLVGLYGSLVQEAKGAISGGIQNRSNDYLQQARVTLFNDDLSFFREVRSNDQGEYSFEHLPSGSYNLGISARGPAYEETIVEIRNSRQTLRFVLEQETEQGRWEVIGDTTPERFGGTNSGVLMPDGRIIFCHNTIDPVVFDPVSREKSFPKQSAELSHSSNSMQGCHTSATCSMGECSMSEAGRWTTRGISVPGSQRFGLSKPLTQRLHAGKSSRP